MFSTKISKYSLVVWLNEYPPNQNSMPIARDAFTLSQPRGQLVSPWCLLIQHREARRTTKLHVLLLTFRDDTIYDLHYLHSPTCRNPGTPPESDMPDWLSRANVHPPRSYSILLPLRRGKARDFERPAKAHIPLRSLHFDMGRFFQTGCPHSVFWFLRSLKFLNSRPTS